MNGSLPKNSAADILIVDDNLINIELLDAMLEDEGYTQIEGMSDPRKVKARVKSRCPDLILLDIRMPYLSGFEVVGQLQEAFGDQAPAIIILTAQIDDKTRYRALELGVRDFLTKPFDQLEVLQRIRNTLQLQRLMQEQAERTELLETLVAERTRELAVQSRQDPLTGLPNRRALIEELSERLDQAKNTAVLFLAIEGMGDIARLHGFTVADCLSTSVAERLQALPSLPNCYLALWNSTEWIMLCECAPEEVAVAPMADEILASFNAAFEAEKMALHLSARIGISASLAGRSAEQLVRMAALALPHEDCSWQGYDDELESRLQRHIGMREALRGAAQRGEMHLLYQPKVDINSGEIVAAEALLRWESPNYGSVSPGEFIPIAEASGEILEIGAWVIRDALETLGRWREQGVVSQHFSVAVNVATIQLMQSDFAQWMMATVAQSPVPSEVFELEITESGLMQDMALANRHLTLLSEAGFRIAIDDFGTGYSSLAYLKSLPISVLKIDRAFIKELQTSLEDQRLTSTVIDMARHFGFSTVAEGVELPEQLELLKQMGCNRVQGFLFSPPLREAALLKLIANGLSAHL
ncbi:EAL domain-containing protein [Marinobacter sp.]|uniref:putative bifunctional diguanylate cyclase/phosphodiesterase n=1 Tax=Marinobacter sp. TaxID=50741 RepID=UPI001B67BEC9|nr:EAL domain-containing protein [Marinobacter sp.]MBQ0834426.1 EAL domain-containing protein [Marinobacter sp.]